MRTSELIAVLHRAGLPVEAIEVAESLWLAATVEALVPQHQVATPPLVVGPPAGVPDDVPLANIGQTADEEPTLDLGPLGTDDDPTIDLMAEPAIEGVPLTLPTAGEPEVVEVAGRAFPVSKAPALPDRAALLRALRPLKRRIDSRRDEVLDEDATAQRIADGGPPSPVLRPARERWLDAVVVVDSAPSMDLWTSTASELRSALRQLGAFRDIRQWRMVADSRNGPAITPYRTQSALDQEVRAPSELIDFSGRRLFLVFTDATSEAWRNGSAAAMLAGWAKRGYVVIVQPLPERLWQRTALHVRSGTFQSFRPGTFTGEQTFVERRRRPRGLKDQELAVPVVELQPAWFASWSRTLSGAAEGGVEMAAAIITSDPPAHGSASPGQIPAAPGAVVDQFLATASPQACRLAVCLAAVPIDLHVIHLVQRAMVPKSGPTHVAEVLLSGLLHRVTGGTALHRFDFRAGVRTLLLDELRISEMRQVLEAVSDYVSAHGGLSDATFTAIAADDGGTEVAVVNRPFAWIPDELVKRLTTGVAEPPPEPKRPAPPVDAATELANIVPGTLLGNRYQLNERIRHGRTGDVWRGTDQVLRRTVAVKISPSRYFEDPQSRAAFHRQARTIAAISHPSVVEVYDTGSIEPGGSQFVVMEYLSGSDLSETLRIPGRPMAPAPAMMLIAQAADALHAAHLEGVVHGDVNLAALRVLPSGRLVLTGFTLVSPSFRGEAPVDAVFGNAWYTSPEQASHKAVAASDVYALGAVAYHCLSGDPPFQGDRTMSVLIKHLREEPPPLPVAVPAAVATLISMAMAKDVAARPSATAFAGAAWQVTGTLAPPVRGIAAVSPPPHRTRYIDTNFKAAASVAQPLRRRDLDDTVVLLPVSTGDRGEQTPGSEMTDAESELVRLYPPTPRRLFRQPLNAVTILRELVAAARRALLNDGHGHQTVPNRYLVSLSEADHEHFRRLVPPITITLSRSLTRIFAAPGWAGPEWFVPAYVTVELVASPQIRSPRFVVIAETDPAR
ncbi:FhaA domain-containing protein [Actinoplanes sp. NPDC024001]|uniref:FhaA domain-containing protein n=1 Tax=Actinoplanes sp. NPDC024001 TaxID=3154598 RepID=UPI0033D68496